jgi:hypothetical protein
MLKLIYAIFLSYSTMVVLLFPIIDIVSHFGVNFDIPNFGSVSFFHLVSLFTIKHFLDLSIEVVILSNGWIWY